MTAISVATRTWPRRRWWIVVAFVFAVQLGLIFGFSDRRPPGVRQPKAVPTLRVAPAGDAELLALTDPTLFALPHRQGFAGSAWLAGPPPPTRTFEWSEEPRFLLLATQQMGATFEYLSPAEARSSGSSPSRPPPEPTLVGAGPPSSAQAKSLLRLGGALGGRSLIAPIELPPQHYNDLLNPSVIQVVVNPEGQPVFVPVLLSSSGSPKADEIALRLARTARFNPVATGGPEEPANPMSHLVWGRMIFEWQTLPPPTTNAVSKGP
jgi:TonB family protein